MLYSSCEKEERKRVRNSPADNKARKLGGRGVPGARSDSLQSKKTMVMHIVLWKPVDNLPHQKTAMP